MRVKAIGAVVAVAVLGTACSSGSSASGDSTPPPGGTPAAVTLAAVQKGVDLSQCGHDTRTIKHDLGTTTVKGSPTRVVALETSYVDALANMGITPVGIADDKQPVKVTGLGDHVGKYTSVGLRSAPNLSVISSLKPDLIVADTIRDKAVYDQLKGIAPTVSFTSLGAGYKDTLSTDLQVAVAVNRCDQMEKAISAHLKRMSAIVAGAKKASGSFIYADVTPPDFSAHSANQWEPEILEQIGLHSAIATHPGSRNLKLSLEQVFSYNPDVMFLGKDTGAGTAVDKWKSSAVYKQIKAVKSGRVYVVDGTLWSALRSMGNAEKLLQQAIDALGGSNK